MKFFFMSLDLVSFLSDFKDSQLIGGAEKQQFLLINELMRRGHDVLICTNLEKSPRNSGRYRLWRYPREKTYLKYLLVVMKLVSFHPDVVYLRSPSNIGVALVAYTRLFRKKMVFFSAHDTDFDPDVNLQGYIPLFFWLSIKLADNIFVQNKYQAKILHKNFARSGRILASLVDSVEYPVSHDAEYRKYFLWAGRIEPFKCIELLIDIANLMKQETFVVIGLVNTMTSYTEAAVRRLKATENIEYYSFILPQRMGEFYRQAKGLICTSKYEGFSNTFLEAFTCGTPVYTLGVDPDHLIRGSQGKLGWVFSDPIEFAREIYSVMPYADALYMSKYISEHHSIERNVTKFLRLINHA
jgi:glycosyltransferase involved in cell wall biosynthesis